MSRTKYTQTLKPFKQSTTQPFEYLLRLVYTLCHWNSIYSNHLYPGHTYIIHIIMCDDASAGKYGRFMFRSSSLAPTCRRSVSSFSFFLSCSLLSLLLMWNRIGCTVLYHIKIDSTRGRWTLRCVWRSCDTFHPRLSLCTTILQWSTCNCVCVLESEPKNQIQKNQQCISIANRNSPERTRRRSARSEMKEN